MRVKRAGDEEIGDGDAIGRLLPGQRQTAERRAGDGVANVDVHDDGEDGVKGCGEGLERVRRLHRRFGMFHLRDEDEEHEVTFATTKSVTIPDEELQRR